MSAPEIAARDGIPPSSGVAAVCDECGHALMLSEALAASLEVEVICRGGVGATSHFIRRSTRAQTPLEVAWEIIGEDPLVFRLDEEIARTRRLVVVAETAGRTVEADEAFARLGGLLFARCLLGGERASCAHVVHDPGPVGEDGRTTWICRACGEPSAR